MFGVESQIGIGAGSQLAFLVELQMGFGVGSQMRLGVGSQLSALVCGHSCALDVVRTHSCGPSCWVTVGL